MPTSTVAATFQVQSSQSNVDAGLGGGVVTATITVTPIADTPSITNATTNEDTQTTSGLVISRNAADGSETTHFKITGLTGGTLFQSNGTTSIPNNSYITFAVANAGLKFTPTANFFGTGSFNIQAATAAADANLGGAVVPATITVNPIADTPSVTSATTLEDTQSSSGLVITRNANDGAEVTFFKITSISANGTLFLNDGTTPVTSGSFITVAQGNAGLKFTPNANFSGSATFLVQGSLSNVDSGLSSTATATITVTAVADTPSVTNATTNEDTQTTSGLVISRNAADGSEVTHFKITGITGGTLFLNNGTTAVTSGTFLTFAQANAGLKFTPSANFNGTASFNIQAATAAADANLGGSVITANITVNPVADTPSVTSTTTAEDTQTTTGLVISRNAGDGAETTHFKITNITNGTLYQNDGITPISNNAFLTFAQANAGLKFTPNANFSGTGSFQVQASVSGVDAGLGGSVVTATITVTPAADTPNVTNATTNEDTQTTSGLVITRNAGDGAEVTHFKITNIIGGTLYQNNGTTVIPAGTFITFAVANAGLKFTPSANFNGTASFQIQGSTSNVDAGLGGGLATATITVNPIADTPSVTDATTDEDTQTTSGLVISRNAGDGAETTHFKITNISANGTLYLADGTTPVTNNTFLTFAQANAGLKFTPNANYNGTATFQVQASTSNVDAGLGGSVVTATITVNAVADTPSVTNATTDEDVQTTTGLVISRNAGDGAETSHFKITNIVNGTLYLNNGVTQVTAGSFITFAQASAGLKFTPAANFNGTAAFDIQASTSNVDAGLGGSVITATITVNSVLDAPAYTNATTTEDNSTTSGLVLDKNPADGPEVTFIKITNISTNGTLYYNDGVTPIVEGTFLSLAEANAGLKFTPFANYNGTATFQAQSSISNDDGGLGGSLATVTITVLPVADTMSVTDATTDEDTQTTSGLIALRNPADGPETSHIKVTNVQNGTVYQNDGVTVVPAGSFITFAQAAGGLKFTPSAYFHGTASFDLQASVSNSDAGLGGDVVTATITVNSVASPPTVTGATATEDGSTTDGLVIDRAPGDGAEVTNFKITDITGGTLYYNDGVTQIVDGTFLTIAEGNAGLKFTPSPNFNGTATFHVYSSLSADDGGLGPHFTTASIVVGAVADTPSVTNATTNEDLQTTSGLVISRSPVDGPETSHFKITNITNGTLYLHDGTTVVSSGSFITFAQANAGLKFTPNANFFGTGSFDLQASVSNLDSGLGGDVVTATITVNSVADTPSVTNATTLEDNQTTSGLVITRNAGDGAEVTYFKITNISPNGTLYLNDGVTPVTNNSFIAVADGAAGLKFSPNANFNGTATFQVQASLSSDDSGLGGSVVTATITVTAVADTPSVTNATTNEDTQTTSGLVISRNVGDGAETTHFKITNIANGSLFLANGTTPVTAGTFLTFAQANAGLKFTPDANFFGTGSFDLQASTSNVDAGLGGSVVTATITVNSVADTPSVTNATTAEDTQTTSGLVIDRNAGDGAEVTHFKITNISANGTLYLNDGTTPVTNNTFLTYAQANAGLKFTPNANFNGTATFQVQASQSNVDAGLGGSVVTATITVTAVADTPSVTNATTNEDTQTTSGLVISRNAGDGAETTHFKITNIIGGTLFLNNGTTAVTAGTFLTFAQANAGLKFTPSANFNGTASFDIQASTAGADAGLGGSVITATITVNPVADTPSVTNATTLENVQTSSGLVISRNAGDGAETTHFKITSISANGTLYLNDGVTPVTNGTFLTFAQANAGLKFTPNLNYNGSATFNVQASTSNVDAGLGGGIVTATITITPVASTPSVTNASTIEDTQTTSGLVITRNATDGAEVTHVKIISITGGQLYLNNGTTPVVAGSFITFAQGNAGLKFTPTADTFGTANFVIQASTSASDAGLGGGTATASITVSPVADTPNVTGATTNEDTQTTSGLVIDRSPADGAEVTHFKITNITGGTLYQNDGTTVITANSYITYAQANAGLKFTPTANSFAGGSFQVRASTSNVDAGLGGSTVTATITVNPVADTPAITNASTNEDTQTTSGLVITRNAVDGAEVTHFKISGITNGSVFLNDGVTPVTEGSFITFAQGNAGLKFTPAANFNGSATFNVQGSTSNVDAGLGGSVVTATITVASVLDTPTVTNVTTNEDVVSAAGGIIISRNAADGPEVAFFRISGLTPGGTLYLNDGITSIGTLPVFITAAQASAGLRYKGATDFNGTATFQVQASTTNTVGGLGGGLATSTITVTPVADTPSITSAATSEDVQTTSGLVISRNVNDGAEVTHFKITNITNGTLYLNDGVTPVPANSFITFAQGNAGLKFSPTPNYSTSSGTFQVQASTSNVDAGLGGSVITANITIASVNDVPVRTAGNPAAITVNEDSNNVTAVTLGFGTLTYGPGGGTNEVSQTLTYKLVSFPSFIRVFNGATEILSSTLPATLTLAELRGLTYKTVADGNGTGNVVWTVQDNGGIANGGVDTLDRNARASRSTRSPTPRA